jgi:hypothetical protein
MSGLTDKYQQINAATKKPVQLTPSQKAAITRQKNKAERDRLSRAEQLRLAQIVNLYIGGYTLAEIATSIGSTPDEVDQMLQRDTARYIKSQPALRLYVRNWANKKYSELLEAIWEDATDKDTTQKLSAAGFDKKLASQDRAIKILAEMVKLNGAAAPVQQEIEVKAAPEAVEQLVAALSRQDGLDYDLDVFDIVDAELVEDLVEQSALELEVSGNRIEDDTDEEAL